MASIEIPCRDSSEVVEVFLDELPDQADAILDILKDERAPLLLYLQFATAYYSMKKDNSGFVGLLQEGIKEYYERDRVRSKSPTDNEAFIEIATCLAAFHVLEGIRAGKERSSRHFEDATKLLNEAERKDQGSLHILLRKGLVLLARGSFEAAGYQFDMVLNQQHSWLPPKLGLGCVWFCQGKYKEALGMFQTILKQLPNGPVEIRLAIGYCMDRLGFVDAARVAFERALGLRAGRDQDALCALAVLNLNQSLHSKEVFQTAMKQLKAAYELDKSNPVVLNHLGNHFFFKKEYSKAETLLKGALSNAAGCSDRVRAETQYFWAKLAHMQGKYDEAYRAYSEATHLNADLVMAQFGLGQCLVGRKDWDGAIACFERVLAKDPSSIEAARLLGLLYVLTGKGSKGQAEALLRRVITATEDSSIPADLAELFLVLGWLHLEDEAALDGALECYSRAYELDRDRFEQSPTLLNNLAVLLAGKDASGASVMFDLVLSRCRRGGNLYDTVLFNKARLLEGLGREGEAEARRIYGDLLARRPDLVDAHLRLGQLSGPEAADHYKEAIGQDEQNLAAWTLLANNQLKLKALNPARKSFERLLTRIDKHDLYSLVALGNLYVDIGRSDRKAREDCMRRALEFFQKALALQPANQWAAHGIAVVLAETGQYAQAKEIFLQVRLADPSNLDASSNLGHAFVELGQFGAAVTAYETVLAADGLSAKQRVACLLHLGRALYLQGKTEKQPKHLERALGYLTEASQLLPRDLPLQFNAALCHQEIGAILVRSATAEHETALDALAKAKAAYETISRASDPMFDERMLQHRIKTCDGLAASLSTRLEQSQTKDRARQEHLQQLMARRAQEQAALEAEEQARRTAWEAEQARIEATRKEMAAKLKVVEEKIAKTPKHVREEDEDSDDGDDKPIKTRRRRAAKKDTDDIDEEEDEEPIVKRSRASRGRPSALSAEILGSSDLEDDVDVPIPPTSDQDNE